MQEANITVFAIVIGMDRIQDEIFTITHTTGGEAFEAGDPEAVSAVFKKIDLMKQAPLEKRLAETLDDFQRVLPGGIVPARTLYPRILWLQVHAMVAELVALAAVILMAAAEHLHARRVRRMAPLAFGPNHRPALWARLTPLLRVAAVAGLAWGMTTLVFLKPKIHKITGIPESELRDLLLVLDVSPSMRLQDAGKDGKLSRRKRASQVLQSVFERVPMERYRTTVVAVYNGAKPVVVRTTDPEVVPTSSKICRWSTPSIPGRPT